MDPSKLNGSRTKAGNPDRESGTVQVHPTVPKWVLRWAEAEAEVSGAKVNAVISSWIVAHLRQTYPDAVPAVAINA